MNHIDKGKIYIFDANVFINLHRINKHSIPLPNEVWEKLGELMDKGKIISHTTVYKEIVSESKNPDNVSKWVMAHKDSFKSQTQAQLKTISEVVEKYPKLIDYGNERDQADPWLVALAVEMSNQDIAHDYAVVTQENQTSTVKLPAVCREFGIRAIDLASFFTENGITFGISFS